MDSSIAGFLDELSSKAFWLAAICLVAVNGAAVVAFVTTRSRELVNQWTPKLVAADAILLGAGLGVPLVSSLLKFGVRSVAALFGGAAPVPE